MKKILLAIFPALLLLSAISSCDKKDDVTPDPDPDPIDSPKAPEPFMPNVGEVSGMLVAIQTQTKMTQAGMTIDVNTEMGLATFYNSSKAMVEGGSVSLNNTNLDKQTNNSYMKTASLGMTPSDLDLDGGASWSVSGSSSNSVPAITYAHGTDFPSYSGDVPSSITKSSGLSFTFSSSNVDNADSVYVAIITSSKSIIKSYAPNAGTITISANELSSLPNVSDNTAYLEVLPVKIEVRTYSGKKYAFIKEQAVVKNININ